MGTKTIMTLIMHIVTTVVMLATVITIAFPISAPAQGTSLETYRNADLGYAVDYPSGWEGSDAFGILEIDSPQESLVATLQVTSLADDTSLGEFSDGRVQNVEALTRNGEMAVYEDTEFGGNDARGIKYKMNGNTVYVIWTIDDDKAYVLTINIKDSEMTSTLLNQADQIKDSFRLLNTDRDTSVNSESSNNDDDNDDDDNDDDGNNNNDRDNGRDVVAEEGKTPFVIDNTIRNTVSITDTDSEKETDSEKAIDVDCNGRLDFVDIPGICKDSEQDDGETDTREGPDTDKNNNGNGNKHGNDNGNKHGK